MSIILVSQDSHGFSQTQDRTVKLQGTHGNKLAKTRVSEIPGKAGPMGPQVLEPRYT